MCGIAGIITHKSDVKDVLLRSRNVQVHRGPDAQNIVQYKVGEWTVGFAHQRLSILDLSPAGNQPMTCRDFSGSLIFNGEIYNYLELRDGLEKEGLHFNSNSDTEVMLVALHHWAEKAALNKFNGMWAFAWLDPNNRRLILSRDRVGIKPLYYCFSEGSLYFASEIKTILAMVPHKFFLNEQVIGEFIIQSQLETSTETMFRGIYQIPAAHFAVIDLVNSSLTLQPQQFWQIPLDQPPVVRSDDDLIEELRALFTDAVRLRLRSDVPVGVLLSGGIDSSAIACAMRRLTDNKNYLNLLSMVSNDQRFDESPFIDIVANYLGLDVNKLDFDVLPSAALDYLWTVSWHNDEPVAGFSNIGHYLLMEHAKRFGVPVIMSGQGSDELLCGYMKYIGFYLQSLICGGHFLQAARVCQSFIRQETILYKYFFQEAKRYLPNCLKIPELDIRGKRLENYTPLSIGLVRGMTVQHRQALDVQRFSVPTLVHYEDRMSMAWSREIRLPFLDFRLIELLLPLAMQSKLRNGWTKYIFRKAMEPWMPNEIVWRKDKRGFVNPENEWLKHELKEKVTEILTDDCLIYKYELVNKAKLLAKFEDYCRQSYARGIIGFKDIFNPLSAEIWLRRYASHIN